MTTKNGQPAKEPPTITDDRFKPNLERQERARKVREFLEPQSNGARLSWLEIEQATGVSMNIASDGRDLVREGLDRLRRTYIKVQGLGIELSSKENATQIGDEASERVAEQMRLSQRKIDRTLARHEGELSAGEKAKLARQSAVLGTYRLAAEVERRQLGPKKD